jgi:hypothetical protein
LREISKIIISFRCACAYDKEQHTNDVISDCVFGTQSLLDMFVDITDQQLPEPIPFDYDSKSLEKDYHYVYSEMTIYDALACGVFEVLKGLAFKEEFYENFRLFMFDIYNLRYRHKKCNKISE